MSDFDARTPERLKHLTVDTDESAFAEVRAAEQNAALIQMKSDSSEENYENLLRYLRCRIQRAQEKRNRRVERCTKIDRTISTWRKLTPEDSARDLTAEQTGKNFAIPFNIPVLASHLDDMVSYFAEALAPIQNPFSTATGETRITALTKRLNRDAVARNYYLEVVKTVRSCLKYNFGGMTVEWEDGAEAASSLFNVNQPGNTWLALDPYNTFWDPTVTNPKHIPHRAEYAGSVSITNRFEILKNYNAGKWVNVEGILSSATRQDNDESFRDGMTPARLRIWKNPSNAIPGDAGSDSRSSGKEPNELTEQDWSDLGLGIEDEVTGDASRVEYERIKLYCWIVPDQFNLLSADDKRQLEEAQIDTSTFLQLWCFELIDGQTIVSAFPIPERSPNRQRAVIPFYAAYLTEDQVQEAQRSIMELMRGFQRFATAMHDLYVEGTRSNIYGVTVYNADMVNTSTWPANQASGRVGVKNIGNRSVRDVIDQIGRGSNLGEAMQGVESSLSLKDQLFPSQALPGQVSSMERAVTSQVASVVHGAQRSLRMLLRLLDSTVMMPTRMAAVRNLEMFEPETAGTSEVTDEEVAEALGSGIESMEAERIVEACWRLLIAVTQNQESMQYYDVPKILGKIGRLMNLSFDMSEFARPQQPPTEEPPV